ncbi:MAG TPA: cache domain-containing protein, partial [Ktedonobacteraceae bacterium]
MTKHALHDRLRFKWSLTALVSILITLTALLPLLITIAISQMLSRPQLIKQSADAMVQDAHARVQLIDAYLHDRLSDVQTVSNLYAVQQYALGHQSFKPQALNALKVGTQNDVNYDMWSMLDLQGHALLWYPMYPRTHGNKLIPPNMLNQIQLSSNPQISGVYYDPESGEASIVIAMPIVESTTSRVIGIIQSEINLTYIWNVVNTQVDQQGSYAFILDQNGVRIASTNPGSMLTRSTSLFQAIAPLSATQWQGIVADDLYGNNEKPVTVLSDPALAAVQNETDAPSRFEAVPAGQQETFEIIRSQISTAGWTYFSLRPLPAMISIADQQLHSTLLIAAIVLILAIVIGIASGYHITQPIQRSIEQQRRAY